VSDKGGLSTLRTLSGAPTGRREPWAIAPAAAARAAGARHALARAARTRTPVHAAPLDEDDLADLYGDFA